MSHTFKPPPLLINIYVPILRILRIKNPLLETKCPRSNKLKLSILKVVQDLPRSKSPFLQNFPLWSFRSALHPSRHLVASWSVYIGDDLLFPGASLEERSREVTFFPIQRMSSWVNILLFKGSNAPLPRADPLFSVSAFDFAPRFPWLPP